nr:DNA cross-link repair 1A protein isoform X2 [Drosophila bipectinata]
MSNVGKIRLKTFSELQATANINNRIDTNEAKPTEDNGKGTPDKKSPRKSRVATTARKSTKKEGNVGVITVSSTVKRSSKKTPLPGQMRIDAFFKSSAKNYKVETPLPPISSSKKTSPPVVKRKAPGGAKGRKRLFEDSTTTSSTTSDHNPPQKRVPMGRAAKGKENLSELDVIDLCSEDGDELTIKEEETTPSPVKVTKKDATPTQKSHSGVLKLTTPESSDYSISTYGIDSNLSNSETSQELAKRKPKEIQKPRTPPSTTSKRIKKPGTTPATNSKQRKPKPCPPYKVVEGTTFCVDGFQFGDVAGVTHYFLTHFHADHYIGLTKKFSHPLYMSPVTARLVRLFIKVDEKYIHEIDVDQTIMVDNVEVTAIDANHCPGAVMFYFKLRSGECILHTGDFRACAEMESLPIFWNHTTIDLLYLDTTYLNKNYNFCHQSESVDRALQLVGTFIEKNPFKRILIVCGSYVIGKEKIWLALAEAYSLKVWTERSRSDAISCLGWDDLQVLLTDDPSNANLHVIPMGKVSYPCLVEYFAQYEDQYDMLLGIRPSGWEKNSKPSFGKKISTIGIEYSEHSSYKELERFVRFLKPKRVISTVPVGRDLFVTGDVPVKWYQYQGPASMLSTGFQRSISTFLTTPKRVVPKASESEMIVSPLSQCRSEHGEDPMECVSIASEQTCGSENTKLKSSPIPEKVHLSQELDTKTEGAINTAIKGLSYTYSLTPTSSVCRMLRNFYNKLN